MKADPRTEAEVLALLEGSERALEIGDIETALALYPDEPDVVVYGTGADEKRIGHAELREQGIRDQEQSEVVYAEIKWHSISQSAEGSVAWVAADLVESCVVDGKYFTWESRFTAVLERRRGRWQIVQQHASLPAHPAGTSYPSSPELMRRAVTLVRPRPSAADTIAIMFTDIVSSTPLAVRLGDERWMERLRLHNAVVRKHLKAHGGSEVKSRGDGFMLAFRAAMPAIRCAMDIHREFTRHGERAGVDPLQVRIGIHVGDAIEEDDDFFGEAVILASRIADRASPGQVLVSERVREMAEGVTFALAEEAELKGLAGLHRLYGVLMPGATSGM